MKLGVIRRILKDDLAKRGEVPAWVDALLDPLNQFIGDCSQALTNNLTFPDNYSGKLLTLTFSHGTELAVNPNTKTRVTGVIPLSVGSYGSGSDGAFATLIDKWGWVQKADGTIGLTFYFFGFETTGNTSSGSTSLASLASTTGIRSGMVITGDAIPVGTTVSSISGSTVTMSANALATATGNRVSFSPASQSVTLFLGTG